MTSPRARRSAAGALAGALAGVVVLGAGCSSTGEPGHTAAVDVVRVDAGGVTQTVVPASDGFDRVTVTTATFGADDGVDGVLELAVAGAGVERRSSAHGADLADNAPVTLAFAPVDGSAGETFALTFAYTGEAPLALYRNPHDPYAAGELTAGADPGDAGDLVFQLGHADRVGGTFDALGRVVAEAEATARADPVFLAVWLAVLAGAAAALVRVRSRSHREHHRDREQSRPR